MFNQKNINSIFTDISKSYDSMNNIMSLFQHKKWKQKFINIVIGKIKETLLLKSLNANYNSNDQKLELSIKYDKKKAKNQNKNEQLIDKNKLNLLDCATGSCDIPILLNSHEIARKNLNIVCLDINKKMLEAGREKLINSGNEDIKTLICDSSELQFSDNIFDFYTIVFGIRNVEQKEKAIKEAYRILKPGGYFFCMEFSPPNWPINKIYNLYSRLIPIAGNIFANNTKSYEYLVDSINKFLSPLDFIEILEKNNFTQVQVMNIYLSLVNIFIAKKE